MKIRTDFVTNSSSASFVLARKGELTDKQKEAIIAFVERRFLGERILSAGATEEEVQNAFDELGIDDNDYDAKGIRKALETGRDVYHGYVNFEESDYAIAGLHNDIWNVIERAGKDTFEGIATDLSY